MADDVAADPSSLNATLADMGTARAVRRYTDAPVGDDLIDAVIWGATRASSPNNTQLWHVIVVRDPERRAAIAGALQHFTKWIDQLPTPESASEGRIRAGARGLLTGLADVPVLLFVCVEHTYPAREPDVRYLWSTVGTASQNAIVAARSLGLGATLTMLHVANEERIRALLGLPDGVELGSMITLGWPASAHGPMTRKPLTEVVHHDTW